MLDWLFHPLAIYGFIAAVIGLNLWLFISVKVEHAASAAATGSRVRELETALQEMSRQVAELRQSATQERAVVDQSAAVPELPPGELNLTRRSQALRLSRRGESPERIAALLGIPRNEVDLLLKVQEIITDNLH